MSHPIWSLDSPGGRLFHDVPHRAQPKSETDDLARINQDRLHDAFGNAYAPYDSVSWRDRGDENDARQPEPPAFDWRGWRAATARLQGGH